MPITQDKRLWMAGAGLGTVVMAVVAWFVFIGPAMSQASSLTDEATAVQDQNAILQAKITALEKQKQQQAALTASLRGALAALPTDSGLPAFIRQVNDQARSNRIGVTSISVGGIAPLVVTAAPAPAAGNAGAEPPAAPAPAAGAAADAAAGQLFTIRISIVSTGTVPNQIGFLKAIQSTGPRRALVMSTQFVPASGTAPSAANGSNTMTTELTIFSAPRSPAEQAQLNKLLSGNVTG